MDRNTAYNILGVTASASPEEIKKAYRTMAKEVHPDRNSHPNANEALRAVNEAYTTLKNRSDLSDKVADFNVRNHHVNTMNEIDHLRGREFVYGSRMLISAGLTVVSGGIGYYAIREFLEGNRVAGMAAILFAASTVISTKIFYKSLKAVSSNHKKIMKLIDLL